MAVTSSRQFDLSVMEEQYDEIRNPALGHGMGGIWLESQLSEDPNEIGSKLGRRMDR